MSQIVAGNRRISQRALLLAMAALALAACMLGMASSARAGEWVQRSCSFGGTEYIAPEDWEAEANYGYVGLPPDNCERYYNGGGLAAYAAGWNGTKPDSGTTWRYKAPRYATIAGGDLAVTMTARDGGAVVGAKVKEQPVTLAVCENPGCHGYEKILPITASGASELWETAYCFGNSEGICPAEDFNEHEGNGHEAAEVNITSAQIVLSTNAAPAGSGFSGTLLGGTVTGTGTLNFKATDPGPGVYQARAKIDGQQVWAATPNLDEGKCVSTGSLEGVRAFNYAQPCPTETAVHAEIYTAGMPDGTHALTVEVEDAAGDVATVYAGTLSTLNHLVSTILQPAPAPALIRGPANGTPASENAVLTAHWQDASAASLKSAYGRSHKIIGKLTNTSGIPIVGALIEVSQKLSSLGAVASSIAGTHTGTGGGFTIHVLGDASSSIQLAYRSHLGDAQPATTRTLTLQVPASVHLTVAPHVSSVYHTIVLSGKLAGAIPPGGKKVLFEARVAGGSWIEFHNATVDSHGRFRATHRFTFSGPISYQFRVVCEREADFPFLVGVSNVVRVWER
jgi:hypothetical protein